MANKKDEKLRKPDEDVRVEKPVFKSTLERMIKKKPNDPSSEKKKP